MLRFNQEKQCCNKPKPTRVEMGIYRIFGLLQINENNYCISATFYEGNERN